MIEMMKDILYALIFAGVLAILGMALRSNKRNILSIVTGLIQEAENAIQGSGLGPEKKSKVIAHLEAMGIEVTTCLDAQIDAIVSYLNAKSGWILNSAKDQIEDLNNNTYKSDTAE